MVTDCKLSFYAKESFTDKAIVYIRLRPRCAIVPPTLRPILITILAYPLRGLQGDECILCYTTV